MKHGLYLFLISSEIAGSLAAGLWSCYTYNSDEVEKIKKSNEKSVCERDDGRVFSNGTNANYPGCKSCLCCKRTEPWSCYRYSKSDQKEMRKIGERKVCEKDGGRGYKRGRGRFNRGFKGCGKCRCCERNVVEKCLACDRYFADSDLAYCYNRHCRDLDKFRTFGAGLSADMLCGLCRRLSGRRRRWQCKRKFCV